jgi:hypothetical protein
MLDNESCVTSQTFIAGIMPLIGQFVNVKPLGYNDFRRMIREGRVERENESAPCASRVFAD